MSTDKTKTNPNAATLAKLSASMSSDGKEYLIAEMPLEHIHADKSFNPRQDYSTVPKLAEDIHRNGLKTPLYVTDRLDGKPGFFLVSGFTRFEALKSLENIKAAKVVYRPGMSEKDMAITNAVENESRKNFNSFELAAALERLSEKFGMSAAAIQNAIAGGRMADGDAKNIGKQLSISYINNLLNARKELAAPILKAWGEGHEKFGLTWAFSVKPAPHKAQVAAWEDRLKGGSGKLDKEFNLVDPVVDDGVNPEGDTDASGDGSRGPVAKTKKPGPKAIEAAYDMAVSMLKKGGSDRSEAELAVIKETLGWVLGRRANKHIKGVTDIEPADGKASKAA